MVAESSPEGGAILHGWRGGSQAPGGRGELTQPARLACATPTGPAVRDWFDAQNLTVVVEVKLASCGYIDEEDGPSADLFRIRDSEHSTVREANLERAEWLHVPRLLHVPNQPTRLSHEASPLCAWESIANRNDLIQIDNVRRRILEGDGDHIVSESEEVGMADMQGLAIREVQDERTDRNALGVLQNCCPVHASPRSGWRSFQWPKLLLDDTLDVRPGHALVPDPLGQDEDVKRAKSMGAKAYFVKADSPILTIADFVKKELGV